MRLKSKVRSERNNKKFYSTIGGITDFIVRGPYLHLVLRHAKLFRQIFILTDFESAFNLQIVW